MEVISDKTFDELVIITGEAMVTKTLWKTIYEVIDKNTF